MWNKKQMRSKARISILSELMSFPTINQKDWLSELDDDNVKEGDLISLNAAPESKWYLSWVIDIENQSTHGTKYLLESIDDGELCWWSNIGINIYSREKVNNRPRWKWTDDQFAFSSRWGKACGRQNAYIVLPCSPSFGKGDSVTLDVRVRHGLTEFSNKRTFDNFRKVKIKDMESYYLECVELYKS